MGLGTEQKKNIAAKEERQEQKQKKRGRKRRGRTEKEWTEEVDIGKLERRREGKEKWGRREEGERRRRRRRNIIGDMGRKKGEGHMDIIWTGIVEKKQLMEYVMTRVALAINPVSSAINLVEVLNSSSRDLFRLQ